VSGSVTNNLVIDLLDFCYRLDDLVDDAVLDGFFNRHPIVPVSILFDLLKRPTRFIGDDLVDPFLGF
jgi:hypothetical protein